MSRLDLDQRDQDELAARRRERDREREPAPPFTRVRPEPELQRVRTFAIGVTTLAEHACPLCGDPMLAPSEDAMRVDCPGERCAAPLVTRRELDGTITLHAIETDEPGGAA